MTSNPSDLLRRLPSASELLDKPPVRALVNRWNRSFVVAGVRSFLDELRSDLERRAADINLPSVRELAERAARHVAALEQPAVRPAINATGRFFGPDWIAAPLADEALERMVAVGRSSVLHSPADTAGDVAAALRRLTGAEAATVVASYGGAVWLALAALAAGSEAVVARGQVGEVEAGCSLATLARCAAVSLREVGAVNCTTATDYEQAVNDQSAAILRHTPDHYRVTGSVADAEFEALVGLARDRELPLIDLLGAAPLVDDLPGVEDVRSVAAGVAAGANLLVARGEGLIAGPRCGILVGTRALVERIESQPLFSAWRADPLALSALQATLMLYHDRPQLRQTVPLFQLLSASVENLRQRAERLAPQLAHAEGVQSAAAVPSEACLGLAHRENDKMASFAVAIAPANADLNGLLRRLHNATVPVVGRASDDALLLDLRTVLPRQDQLLVEMVAGRGELAAKTAAAPTAAVGN